MGHSRTVTIQKNRAVISQSFFFLKKETFFNNKEQNISNQSSGVIGPTILLAKQLQTNAISFLIESLWSSLLKIIDFSINNGLINFSSIFFLICSTFSLVSAKKDCFFFLLI